MNKLTNFQSFKSWNNLRSALHTRLVSIYTPNWLNQDWRREQRLPKNPNAEGPLTDLPDFTYMDGRPTPLGRRQKTRVLFQRELAKKIVTGSYEIDYAIKRHERMENEKVKAKQDILDSKLKPKGHLLLKKK